jgi:hypothetical protein
MDANVVRAERADIVPIDECIYHPRGEVIAPTERNYVTRANSEAARKAREYSFRLSDAIIASHQSGETELPPAPLRHFFADGVYLRELFMPAGMVGIAMIHKHEHIVHVSYGDFFIVDGETKQRMTGTHTFISPPGAKRNFIVLADTLISTIHKMRDPEDRDIESVENTFFCTTEEAFQEYLALCTDNEMV